MNNVFRQIFMLDRDKTILCQQRRCRSYYDTRCKKGEKWFNYCWKHSIKNGFCTICGNYYKDLDKNTKEICMKCVNDFAKETPDMTTTTKEFIGNLSPAEHKVCKYCGEGFFTTGENICDQCKDNIADTEANERLVDES